MAQISMEPSEVISCGKTITENAAIYNEEIKNIYLIVDDLKKSWTGTAADRFTGNIENFRKDYEDFGQLITDFGALLEAIGKDYENLENNL